MGGQAKQRWEDGESEKRKGGKAWLANLFKPARERGPDLAGARRRVIVTIGLQDGFVLARCPGVDKVEGFERHAVGQFLPLWFTRSQAHARTRAKNIILHRGRAGTHQTRVTLTEAAPRKELSSSNTIPFSPPNLPFTPN